MASRLLGVARETVLASLFGASKDPSMDAFNVAFRVPNLVRDLFAEGAMTAAFVPTFTRTLNGQGREAAWRLGNLVINALLVVTALLVVLGIIFARPITTAIASGGIVDFFLHALGFGGAPTAGRGFLEVQGKLELTTQLTQIMMPFLMTIAVAVAMMGMLNSLHRFFIPAISPAMFNVATILCAFVLVPYMPAVGLPPIAGIAIATVLGGIGQIAVQWPSLRREGFRYRPVLDFRDPGVREILRLMGPGTLG
ncbi:MAG TPA: lipid II flippase MurJ, partial [Vicinamibacterales bacterium]|nr:lipid II flippase MurJ [Vicinamibacterales bacterium]